MNASPGSPGSNRLVSFASSSTSLRESALDALALRETIEPREFYQRVAANLKVPWRFAVGGDFAFPETTGPKPRGIGLLNGYTRRLQHAAKNDPAVRRAFTSVQHLIEPPSILFRPSTALRVMRSRQPNF